jgi:hypothetical protein
MNKTYEKMLSRVNNDGERIDQLFTSMWKNRRGNNGNVLKPYTIKAFLNRALDVGERVQFGMRAPRWEVRICVNSVEGRDQSIDAAGVACEFGKVLDGVHHSSSSVS